jgi:protein-tyrosine phosphatase
VTTVVADRFEILFVCHANLCRSPMAELLARRAFDETFGVLGSVVTVASAGTRAYAGSAMHKGSATVLAAAGIDPGAFVARTVDASVLATADLVLTAGREHRAACAALAPGKVRRAFTLRQFTRLVDAVGPVPGLGHRTVPDRLHVLVDRVNATRHLVAPVAGELDDLPDPVNQPIEAFEECADEIRASLDRVLGVIASG